MQEQVSQLRAVGAEDIRTLLRRPHLRRAIVRLGLVAWRAVQPSGEQRRHKPARIALGALKPGACLPVLLAMVAPTGTIVAAALSWAAVAVVAGTWLSLPAHLAIAVGASMAVGIRVWRRQSPSPVPAWKAVTVGAETLAAILFGARALSGLTTPPMVGTGLAAELAAALFAAAVLAQFWWLPAQGRLPREWGCLRLLLMMAAGSAVATLLAVRVVHVPWLVERMGSWRMLFVLYMPF